MKILIILILICFAPVYSTAQSELDSLWSVWENEEENDTNRLQSIRLYTRKGFLFSNQDSARKLAHLQYQYADKNNYTFYKADAINTQGISYAVQSKFHFAIEKYMQALKIYEQGDLKEGEASVLNNIGILYSDLGNFEKSIEYYERSLSVKRELGDSIGMASTLNNIGIVYKGMGDFEMALEKYKQCLEIESTPEMEHNTTGTLCNIAIVYKHLDSLEKALETANNAMDVAVKYENINGICLSYTVLSAIYNMKGEYTKGLENAKIAYEIALENGYTLLELRANEYMHTAYKELGQYEKALIHYEYFIAMKTEMSNEENQKAIINQEYKYEYDKQHLADSLDFAKQQELTDIQHQAELDKEAQQRYILYGGLGFLLLIGGLVFRGYQRKKKDNLIIKEQKEKVEQAHNELEEKNQEILDSITYAKRIQSAILPPTKLVRAYIPQSFVLYKPKDIVAGDFYWMEPQGNRVIFAAADCTGHGVPGAMVSVVCNNGLNRSVREFGFTEPGDILTKTRELVIAEFEKSEEAVKDGMDIALVSIEETNRKEEAGKTIVKYAGAHNPLWIIRKDSAEIEEIKADKQPIGKFAKETPFTTHEVKLNPGDSFYIFSDGFADQFGGEKGKKFKAANFKKLLLSIQTESIEKQRELINQAFEDWKGNLEQLDDVCVIGVRI